MTQLTPRESEVLKQMVDKAFTRAEVAQYLHISPKTLEIHLTQIAIKRGADTPKQIVEVELRRKLRQLLNAS